jgi:hypothetical protein
MNAPPVYPESLLLRGGVSFRIVKPLMLLMVSPMMIAIGAYAVSQAEWGIAAFFGLPSLLLIFLFGIPLRRAGSFELTSHRLRHKPWFRPWRDYPLAAIPPRELDFDGQTQRVRAKSIGLHMTYVGSYDALRGALAVWCPLASMPFPAPIVEAFVPWILLPATTSGHPARSGFLVSVGDQIAFVPDAFPPPSTGAAIAGLAVNLLTLPLGVAMVPSYVRPPIADVLRFFEAAPLSIRQHVLAVLAQLVSGWARGIGAVRCTATLGPDGSAHLGVEAQGGETVGAFVGPQAFHEVSRRLPVNLQGQAPVYR